MVNPLPVSVSENDVLCLNCNQMCSISIPHIIQWPFSSSHIDWQIVPIDSPSPSTSSGICGMSIPIIRIIYLSDIKFTDFFNAFFFGTFHGLSFKNNHWCYHLRFFPPSTKQTISLRAAAGRCIICTSNHLRLQAGADPWREDLCKWPILNFWYCTL